MLLRLLLILALIGTVIWLWRSRHRQARPVKPTAPDSEPMVRCAHCGVHVPQRLALTNGAIHYCCQAHEQQGPTHREH
jgi:uncharacterized protein